MAYSARIIARYATAIICACAGIPSPAAAQLAGAFDWSALGVADEDAIPTPSNYNSAGVTTTMSWSFTTDGGTVTPFGGNDFVSYESATENGVSTFGQMGFDNDREDPDDYITVDFSFSAAVSDVAFTITDVDQSGWDDFIEVYYNSGSGFINAKTGSFATLGGAAVVVDDENFGDGWEGAANSGSASTAGNIDFDFGATAITAIRIVYFSGNDATGNNPGGQRSGISDVSYTAPTTDIDLSLAKAVSNSFPNVGSNITYTLTVTNGAPITSATGVQITDQLPSGVSYVSDNGGGAYNSGTGVWTLPSSLAAGANTSLQITASVNGSGNYNNFAEVSAANETDIDSTPGNGNAGEDDDDSLMISPGSGGPGTPPSLTCASPDTLDWDSESWASGAMSNSYTIGGESFVLNWTDAGGNLQVYNGLASPSLQSAQTGGLSPAQQSLHALVNYPDRTSTITFDGDVGTAGTGVGELQFTIFDVDTHSDGASFIDELQIFGRLNGSFVPATLTTGSANTSSGSIATGTASSATTSGAGNVTVTFLSQIDEFFVIYGSSASAIFDPAQQAISIHDISFCPVDPASLAAVKSVDVLNPGDFMIPGNDVVYTIRATNEGVGMADSNSVFLIDRMPPEIEFYNDAFSGGDVIEFTESSSNLTWTEGADLGFSNSGSAPATFAACTFNPATGYDPNITFVCFNPKGAFAGGDPDPYFQVRFRARIK